jgi:hypothetical protein
VSKSSFLKFCDSVRVAHAEVDAIEDAYLVDCGWRPSTLGLGLWERTEPDGTKLAVERRTAIGMIT